MNWNFVEISQLLGKKLHNGAFWEYCSSPIIPNIALSPRLLLWVSECYVESYYIFIITFIPIYLLYTEIIVAVISSEFNQHVSFSRNILGVIEFNGNMQCYVFMPFYLLVCVHDSFLFIIFLLLLVIYCVSYVCISILFYL